MTYVNNKDAPRRAQSEQKEVHMPCNDNTGPEGNGPRTGRGRGMCGGNGMERKMEQDGAGMRRGMRHGACRGQNMPGMDAPREGGSGRGQGRGQGRGRGMRHGACHGQNMPGSAPDGASRFSTDDATDN